VARASVVYENPTPIYFTLNEGPGVTSILLKPVDFGFTFEHSESNRRDETEGVADLEDSESTSSTDESSHAIL